jgi:hypothetical protein
MHWYSFQDAFQGVGAFTPYEGYYGDGMTECDSFSWPSIYATNDLTGNMAMVAITFDQICAGGFDDIKVMHKDFDSQWSDPILLHSMDDPSAWTSEEVTNAGPNIPMLAGADNGQFYVVTCEFGTNVYYWESTDYGVTWSDRLDVTGFPLEPHPVPSDTSSQEYRPLQNSTISVAPDGTPHVVWSAYQAQSTAPDTMYRPSEDGLWQYRTKLEHWDPINGVNTIYRHPDGLANFAGGTAFTYNVGHPSIGFGESGDIIYVVSATVFTTVTSTSQCQPMVEQPGRTVLMSLQHPVQTTSIRQ